MDNNKLELTWYGKEKEIRLEPRILIEKKELSFQTEPISSSDCKVDTDNILIHGDNLLALKALESNFSGRIKCIYIDPPYNTGSAFSTYDDNLEHSTWLSLMKPRIELLRNLLTNDGSLWISIDDDERDYLKVLCDEIFGRRNFVTSVIWQKKFSPQNDARWLSDNHDYILIYAKNKEKWRPNLLQRSALMDSRYKNPDNDPRGPWTSGDLLRKDVQKSGLFQIVTPNGRVCNPPEGRSWRTTPEGYKRLLEDNRLWFGKDGNGVPRIKRFLSEVQSGSKSLTIWLRDEVGDNQEATREAKVFNKEIPFPTPKPERLIKRILELSTNPGDWVLDSFLGSGTTVAVSQKMGRHWIGVELTDVVYTHDIPRINAVISGRDAGGITKEVGWQGGGGYKFYELAPSLIKFDSFGQPIINSDYSPEMLAAAVAKHEGYKFNPDSACYWKQSVSEEHSYLYVTTQHINEDAIQNILNEMMDDEFLLIVCKSFDSNILSDLDKRISIKKIPQSLLKDCEFGVDNYNLNIVCPPEYEEEDEENE